MAIQEICTVAECTEIAPGMFLMVLDAPKIAPAAKPGQFVHLSCGEGNLLRRPISICTQQDVCLRLVFQVKGEGTKWLSTRQVGDHIDVLGPLGNGFALERLGDRPVLIGGGIGVPPMLYAMQMAKNSGASPTAILGFRSREAVILEDEFKEIGTVYTATDDGSYGVHGFVSDVLRAHIGEFTAVCACGPKPMLHALAQLAEEAGLPCQVSMEERMGCGIGACLVCACALQAKDGGEGVRYGHVCKDGPVFDAREVVW